MSTSQTRFVLVVALSLAGVAPAFAHKDGTEWLLMMERLRQQRAMMQQDQAPRAQAISPSTSGRKAPVARKEIKRIDQRW